MPGAPGFKRKKNVDFKGMDKFIKKYNKELQLYIEVSFSGVYGAFYFFFWGGGRGPNRDTIIFSLMNPAIFSSFALKDIDFIIFSGNVPVSLRNQPIHYTITV